MERLWAPWRVQYIKGNIPKGVFSASNPNRTRMRKTWSYFGISSI